MGGVDEINAVDTSRKRGCAHLQLESALGFQYLWRRRIARSLKKLPQLLDPLPEVEIKLIAVRNACCCQIGAEQFDQILIADLSSVTLRVVKRKENAMHSCSVLQRSRDVAG